MTPEADVRPVQKRAWRRVFSRYLVVGLFGTAVHFLTTIALVEWLEVEPVSASVAGFVLTVLVSYALNSFWTFQVAAYRLDRLFKYSLVSFSGLLLNTLIMFLAVERFDLHYLFGLALVVLVIPPYNFCLNLFWSFREPRAG